MKNFKYFFIVIVFIVLVFFIINKDKDSEKEPVQNVSENNQVESKTKPDVANLTYDIDGDVFTLKNGVSEKETSSDGATNSLTLFGEVVYEDLDADGDIDAAVWLLNDPGGTGRFHYAMFVINNGNTFKTTNAIFLGDRISPKKLEIKEGHVVYSFLERKESDPMTAEPSVDRDISINYNKIKGEIGEWVKVQ